MKNTKKIARLALLCALALLTFMLESLLPPVLSFAPGTKIGLASIFVNLALIIYGEKEAFIVLAAKCFLGALFSGNVFSLYYSVPAGTVSLVFAILLLRYAFPKTGIVTVSVIPAILHNALQILMAALLFNTPQFMYYVLIASAAGFLAGLFTGFCIYFIIRYVPENILKG